jgi:RNA polymerase sigma-70 factor (ECF subfamily)
MLRARSCGNMLRTVRQDELLRRGRGHLLVQVRSPSDDGLVQVWREFADRLRVFFRARAGENDADDLVQETMLRLVRHRDRLRDAQSVSGWVWSVARSVLVDHHRRGLRAALPTDDVDVVAHDQVVDDSDAVLRLAACLEPMLATLPTKLADAVRAVEVDGQSQVAAARAAGISNSGMKSRVQRGRTALRDVIERCCHIEVDARGTPRSMSSRPGDVCGCGSEANAACTAGSPRLQPRPNVTG